MPTGGWKNGTLLQLIVLCGIAVILLLVEMCIRDRCTVFYRGLFINDFRVGTTGETNGTSHYSNHTDTTDTCGELASFRPAFP